MKLDLKKVEVDLGDICKKKIDLPEQDLNRNARSHRNTNGRVLLDTIQHIQHSPNFGVS